MHRNAKMTPAGRKLLVQRVLAQGWTVHAAAHAAGVSRRTDSKWLTRYRTSSVAALEDRSSALQRQARRTPAATTAAIVALCDERLTAWTIAQRLQMPRSTVAGVLAR